MSLVVNTNTQSLFAQRALAGNTASLKKNIENLSTGSRINRAADDAAGLSISNKLTTEIRGLEKARQNIGDGISLIETMEGAISVIQENVQRIRELFVQGSNGTNGTNEIDAIQREINERISTIDAIVVGTKFNGGPDASAISLLYNHPDVTLQVGANDNETFTLAIDQNTGSASPPVGPYTGIDLNIDYTINGSIGDYGQLHEGASTGFKFSRIRLSGTSINAHDGYNSGAHGSIDDIDATINSLSRMRSYLGASMNALESKRDYIDVAIENASASRSRIQDVDVARESSILVKNQILQQTSAAMLSQANSQPQIALQLIGGQ